MAPPAASDLKFVNLSHPEDIKRHKKVRTEIRRHVMKGIGERRRRPRVNNVSPSTMPRSTEAVNQDFSSENLFSNHTFPSRSLAPLGSFPIPTDMRVVELVHFANDSHRAYQPFRSVWFEISLHDPGAFHVTLGNTAAYWGKIKPYRSTTISSEASNHYALSVQYLRRRLNSVAESISEGAIANILAHICLNMRNLDWDSWRVHMDGLSLIWKLRAGFADLSSHIRILLLLYDVAGGMMFDTNPRFPLPVDLLTSKWEVPREVPFRLQALFAQSEQLSPEMASAAEAMRMMSSIADAVNLNSRSVIFWQRDIEAITLIGPCIHFLLSMPRLPDNFEDQENSEDLIAREMVRLVCLMIISRLKEMFMFFTAEKASLDSRLAQFMSVSTTRLRGKYFDLKIWALVTSALLHDKEGRGVYLSEIRQELSTLKNTSAWDFINIAKSIVWLDVLESPFMDELAQNTTAQITLH